MKRLLSLCLAMIVALGLWGTLPRMLRGTVCAPDGNPLPGATVKLLVADHTKSFTRSGADGTWSLNIPELPDTVQALITVGHLSYASDTLPLPDYDGPLNLTMHKVHTLREVTVSAPALVMRGDTLSFYLSAFMSQGDVSLEDALRKIPGITVNSSGSISYLGKDISNFYIEGLDMLGGRYAIATHNLPAEYVNSVEVLSNHQKLKKDKGKLSDKVALNIRLKNKVKFKPVGTVEGALGYGDRTLLYSGSATMMMFSPLFQTLLTAKCSNLYETSRYENNVHIVGYNDSQVSLAEKVLGNLSGDTPSLPSRRYNHPHDLNTSLNTIRKLGENRTLTANVTYSFMKSHYDYSSAASYFTGEEPVIVMQRMTPHASIHKPALTVDYSLNSPTAYRRNILSASAEISEHDIVTVTPSLYLDQSRKARTFSFSNSFENTVRSLSREWHLSSAVSFTLTPVARLSACGDESADFNQRADSRTFSMRQRAYTSFIRRRTEIFIPIEIRYTYSDIRTILSSPVIPEYFSYDSNRAYYNSFIASLSPGVEYNSGDARYCLRFSVPISLTLISGHNAVTSNSFRSLRPYLDPSFSVIINLNAKSALTFQGFISTAAGDALDLLDSPVQTSWRSVRVRSGLIARSTSRSLHLRYDFKMPFDYLFFNTAVSYSSMSSNLMTDQTVTPDYNIVSTILSPLNSNTVSGNFRLTKTICSSKLSLGGTVARSTSRMIQQQIPVGYHTFTWSVNPVLNLRPLRLLEANLSATYSASRSSYLGTSSRMSSTDSKGSVILYLTPGLQVITSADYTLRRLPDSSYKHMTLFDAAIRLKRSHMMLTLSLDNLLDSRDYTYTVFSGVDTYTYSYVLRGRTITLSARFTM